MQEPDPPLHDAAKAGDADKVKSLLEAGADPCQADARGKVPYDVAADKSVRDAFRRSAHSCFMTSLTQPLARLQHWLNSNTCLYPLLDRGSCSLSPSPPLPTHDLLCLQFPTSVVSL